MLAELDFKCEGAISAFVCHFQNYLAQIRQHYLACLVFLRGGAGGLARSRQTVAGWILNSRAASAAVLSPLEPILLISAFC